MKTESFFLEKCKKAYKIVYFRSIHSIFDRFAFKHKCEIQREFL